MQFNPNNPIFQMFGGFNNFNTQFNQFAGQFQNGQMNPEMIVRNLLNTGQMTQEQFNQYRDMANQMTGTKR